MTRPPFLSDSLAATLARLAGPAAALDGHWWIIGSAAAALHGARVEVADVDLLAAPDDAVRLLGSLGIGAAPGEPSDRFRSDVFGRSDAGPLPVEVMGGFHIRTKHGWRALLPKGRLLLNAAGASWPVPPLAELIEIGRLFGRAKDLERVAALEALP